MDFPYEDIIDRQRPEHRNDAFSREHPPMAQLNRAKIFAPYAALRGFETHIEAKREKYVPRCVLDPEEKLELNRRIGILAERCADSRLARQNRVQVAVEHFVPCGDSNHEDYRVRGQYKTSAGIVRGVDIPGQTLRVDGEDILFENIRAIRAKGKLFARKKAEKT